ncbi:ABC transporter substrate-binding protein [Gordonia sp. (in: high G+C Gram-positive bacteria)]|uniref:ABC transporter substrate-binding protein n=1 Tax=unclassified Gordonia (in: high G+C Gram-positive bacteria) TaxID=2657482 RepID=UPI003527854D
MFTDFPISPARRRIVAAAVTVALAAGLTACGNEDDTLRTPDGKEISTVTTRIARVNIVNAGRDFAQTCLAPTAADPGHSDVSRIVVTDPALLDAVCALGIGPKVRAVTAGAGSVPAYLGPALGAVPTIGDRPSRDAVATAAPQLVLTTASTTSDVEAMRATGALGAARVVTIAPGDWRSVFTAVAGALGRSRAGADRLDEFDTEATRVGRVQDAAHSQVSLVRFTPDAELLEGTGNFAAQILAQIGVQRPAPQRGPDPVTVTDANFTDADADLIYVSADGPKGLERGTKVLQSDRWQEMGAPSWSRVLWVDDQVWYASSGLAAAWLVLNDVKSSLNGSSAGE